MNSSYVNVLPVEAFEAAPVFINSQVSKSALPHSCFSALQCSHTEAVAASGLRERVERQTRLCSKCSRDHLWSAVRGRLSILGWLLEYRVCHALLGDVITGVTVGIMHIPQGLGYAMLAGLPPITGLYMAFFPALVYVLMGTSRHVSIGTFAVSCMMMEKLVLELSTGDSTPTTTPGPPGENGTLVLVPDGSLHSVATSLNATAVSAVVVSHSSQEVAAVLALAVGMWQVLMGVLQVGQVFSVLLSHMITSAFTTSVAFLVLTSQLKNVLGIPVPRHSGPFKTIYVSPCGVTYRDLCLGLPSVNPVVVGVSVVCIVTLVANNELLKPRLRKVSRIPVPMELLVVVAGTAVSHLLHLEERHHVTVIGQVPTGLPPPSAPRLELLSAVLVDGFLIALISYTSTFSIAKIFAQRQGYTVDAAQELYAQGMSNAFGSFFSCGPVAASMSRSLVQEAAGGVTQLITAFSCAFLVLCVLSAVILVSLKGLLLQVKDLTKLWSSSRLDTAIWLATFVVSLVVGLDYGLLAGLVASAVVLLLRAQRPLALHLGHVPFTDLYLDLKTYHKAVEVPGVKIFQFGGPLHFGNASYFHSSLFSVTGLDLAAHKLADAKFMNTRQSELHQCCGGKVVQSLRREHGVHGDTSSQDNNDGNLVSQDKVSDGVSQASTQDAAKDSSSSQPPSSRDLSLVTVDSQAEKSFTCFISADACHEQTPTEGPVVTDRYVLQVCRWLVLDLSLVSFVDTTGASMLKQLHHNLQTTGVTLCLASASDRVVDALERCGVLEEISRDLVFHSTHDAITTITCPRHFPTTLPDL
ncbi:Solute carrier family 26 member 6 [Portunus trituberculatus]|uniref:Solute carrier family 26 member 6 n=1 Tax=Portunus trituberculatus TaxID=210409 RepID=A0A5B7D792_PORTR|nr:Solute carrier family 26 member 6 [Portunus trituberculatus]